MLDAPHELVKSVAWVRVESVMLLLRSYLTFLIHKKKKKNVGFEFHF